MQYDVPIALTRKMNAWADRRCIDLFVRYCKTVMTEYRGLVNLWLTFNEINILTSPVCSYLTGGLQFLTAESEFNVSGGIKDTPQQASLRFQALHHQFIASALVVRAAHEIDPQNRVGFMVSSQCTYPRTCSPEDLLAAQHQRQIVNYLCSDVQVRGAYLGYGKRYFKENGIEIHLMPEDLHILKNGCVDFYSFSYYQSRCVSAVPSEERV